MAINPEPTTTIQMSAVPGPVTASVLGALDVAGIDELDPEAAVADEAAAVAGAAAGEVPTAVVGGLVDAVERGVVVAVGAVVATTVVPGVGGGAVVEGVGVDTTTTVNPATLFPDTWPGEVSLTKVYSGEPL